MSPKVAPSRYTRVLGSRKTMVAVHDREIADVRKGPAASLLVLDCEARSSELLHLLLEGSEFLGLLRSSRKEKRGTLRLPSGSRHRKFLDPNHCDDAIHELTLRQDSCSDYSRLTPLPCMWACKLLSAFPNQYDLWCQIDLHPSKLRTRNPGIAFTACRQIAKQH